MFEDSVTRFIPRPDDAGGDTLAQLVILEGADPGVRYDLVHEVTTMGRRQDNTLVLDSSSVSKYHGRLYKEGTEYFIEDLGSTNGIMVNSAQLGKAEVRHLCHGDTLRISDHLLLFRYPRPLSDAKGMSTITFDAAQVREEVNELFKDLPGLLADGESD